VKDDKLVPWRDENGTTKSGWNGKNLTSLNKFKIKVIYNK